MPSPQAVQERERGEMIEGLLDVIERTWSRATEADRLGLLRSFFADLDDDTLRAISYQHGLFDFRPETDAGEARQDER